MRVPHLIIKLALVLGALFALLVGLWLRLSWDEADPQSARYVLWRAGILKFESKIVYRAMVLDTDRDSLVMGLTVDELARRFGGDIRTREAAGAAQVLQSVSIDHGLDIRWLGNSDWLVVLREGRVTELRFMK